MERTELEINVENSVLEEILGSHIENLLCILWKRSKNPVFWIMKAPVLLYFILG
jgi:hypothetical protein